MKLEVKHIGNSDGFVHPANSCSALNQTNNSHHSSNSPAAGFSYSVRPDFPATMEAAGDGGHGHVAAGAGEHLRRAPRRRCLAIEFAGVAAGRCSRRRGRPLEQPVSLVSARLVAGRATNSCGGGDVAPPLETAEATSLGHCTHSIWPRSTSSAPTSRARSTRQWLCFVVADLASFRLPAPKDLG